MSLKREQKQNYASWFSEDALYDATNITSFKDFTWFEEKRHYHKNFTVIQQAEPQPKLCYSLLLVTDSRLSVKSLVKQ